MKKCLLSVLLLMIAILSLTGCKKENKEIVCKMTQSQVDVELTMLFSGKKIENMKIKSSMDLSNYKSDIIEAIKKQDFCVTVKTVTGFNDAITECNQEIKDNNLLNNGNIDIEKLDYEIFKEKTTEEEIKEVFEQKGYTCEIK